MSKATTADSDSADSETVVDRFKDAFPWVEKGDEYVLTRDEVDGECWISDSKVILYHEDELTEYGNVDVTDYEPADYVETRTIGDSETRCYGFTRGDGIEWVDVKFVRALANEVFNVEYDTLKQNAETIPDQQDYKGNVDISPVNFNIPDSPWHVGIAPVKGPDE